MQVKFFFYYFDFERNYDVLNSKCPYFLLHKNVNFDKNETELEMENPTHAFRETSLVFQVIQELRIKCKTVMSWSSPKKKEAIFLWRLFCPKNIF